MESSITLAEVIETIDSGRPFDIEVVTADITRGTGGKMVAFSNCVKEQKGKKLQVGMIDLQKIESQDSRKTSGKFPTRNPNHYINSTRNIRLLKERTVKKIHLRLITRFNGKIVL